VEGEIREWIGLGKVGFRPVSSVFRIGETGWDEGYVSAFRTQE
jgi:hypothetical protein